ncbi:hypothetical protein GCM10027591_12530 [Zhihengliuella somnathii]
MGEVAPGSIKGSAQEEARRRPVASRTPLAVTVVESVTQPPRYSRIGAPAD